MAAFIVGFAVVCIILSVGLQRRAAWMWYVGWALFYLFAAYFGQWFFAALYVAATPSDIFFACIYLAGGFAFWIPAVGWWAKRKHLFRSTAKPGQTLSASPSNRPKA